MEQIKQQWDNQHERILGTVPKQLNRVKGVVVGFNTVTDGFRGITPAIFEKLAEDPEIAAVMDRAAAKDELPQEIDTLEDLFAGFLYTLRRGKSYRINVRNTDVHKWIMAHMPYERLQLGGTSGNMANALADCGTPNVVVYAHPFSNSLGALFSRGGDLRTYYQYPDGSIVLKHPGDIKGEDEIPAVHWVWEFRKGDTFQIGGETITASRNNRYYPCWNPINNKLKLNPGFIRGLMDGGESFSHFLISGFHLLSESYSDNTSYIDYMEPVIKFIRDLRKAHPHIGIHLEFGSIPSDAIRGDVIRLIVPNVHSLGMNEVELCAAFRALGVSDLANEMEAGDSPVSYVSALLKLMEQYHPDRIHFHNLGYYISVLKDSEDAAAERDALLASSIVAGFRAETGKLTKEAGQLALQRDIPFKSDVFAQMNEVREAFGLDQSFLMEGIGIIGAYKLVMVPARVVDKPIFTVGLGDTISATGFLYRNN